MHTHTRVHILIETKTGCLNTVNLFPVDHIQLGKHHQQRSVSLVSDLQQVRACCGRMHDMLLTVTHYVDDVLVSNSIFPVITMCFSDYMIIISEYVVFN